MRNVMFVPSGIYLILSLSKDAGQMCSAIAPSHRLRENGSGPSARLLAARGRTDAEILELRRHGFVGLGEMLVGGARRRTAQLVEDGAIFLGPHAIAPSPLQAGARQRSAEIAIGAVIALDRPLLKLGAQLRAGVAGALLQQAAAIAGDLSIGGGIRHGWPRLKQTNDALRTKCCVCRCRLN